MAIVLPKFPSRGVSTRRITRYSEPALGLRLLTLQAALEPAELLEFEYRLQRVSSELIDNLEVSVMWMTEGKGSEDIGIHFFQKITKEELVSKSLESPRSLQTKLPTGPLSYEGRLLKIRWQILLRLFLADGREVMAEKRFYLGHLTSEV